MRWQPSFHYGVGHASVATLSYPIAVWVHGGRTVGSTRRVASGLPHASIVQRYHQLGLTLRFKESDWPMVRQAIAWGQTGATLLWIPGDLSTNQIGASVEIFMDSPRMRDAVRPVRDSIIPWLMTLNIVIRRADNVAWDLQYFREPPATALAATDIEFDRFTAQWVPFLHATGYEIDVSEDEQFLAGVTTYTADADAVSLVIEDRTPQTLYYYRVRALYRNPPFPATPNSNTIEVETTESFLATGGVITYDGNYTIHTFSSPGDHVFEVIRGHRENVEVLIVGGGGSGGKQTEGGTGGGGGGAGRVKHLTTVVLDETDDPHDVRVGGGGVPNALVGGNNGATSWFDDETAPGGGAGGHGFTGSGGAGSGANGGSGGGGASTVWFTGGGAAGLEVDGVPSAGMGQNGGAGGGSGLGTRRSGGGGGATQVGASGPAGGKGGDGYADDISGAMTTYGGGGGSCSHNNSAGPGGAGGGGRGGSIPDGPPVAGTDGLGGGGGGAWEAQAGARGGNGVVIIRYQTELP